MLALANIPFFCSTFSFGLQPVIYFLWPEPHSQQLYIHLGPGPYLAPVSSPLQELGPCPNNSLLVGILQHMGTLPRIRIDSAWLPGAPPLLCLVLPDWAWCPQLLQSCPSLLYKFHLGFVLTLWETTLTVHLLGSSSTGPASISLMSYSF